MAGAAVYAAPARYEPFGLAVLEAAVHGCALALGDLPTLRELWDGAARFVPPGDPGALRRALLDLIGDGAERERLGALAQGRARAFTRERMVEGYLDAYAGLLAGNALTPALFLCEGEGVRGGTRAAAFAPSPSARRERAGVRASSPLPPKGAAA
jgi:hypothetical protein